MAEQRQEIKALRNQLKIAQSKEAGLLQKEQANFAQREKAIVEKVNALEKARGQATQKFHERLATLHVELDRKEGEWKRKLLFTEGERDKALSALAEVEKLRATDREEWEQSILTWRRETEHAVRAAQLKQAQEAVTNTARLAAEWHAEREELQKNVSELEQLRANEKKNWEQSVADWQERAKKAVRTANVKEAQTAVANTARLATEWQAERASLEAQVKEMSGQLAKLEGQLGVKGFENQQAEVLRLGLTQKSQALEDLGTDAARLATEWRREREDSRRDLDAMRNLYKSTAKDVKTRDQRIRQLDAAVAEKNTALEMLAGEAAKLSDSWKERRGGLQKKIVTLEKKLATSQTQLKEKAEKSKGEDNSKLAKQLAIAADLQSKLTFVKKREGALKDGLLTLREEVGKLKDEMQSYKDQKEKDTLELKILQASLKDVKENYAAAERDLVASGKALAASQKQKRELQLKFKELSAQLAKAQEELKVARKQAEANKKVKAEATAKATQVKSLESQLGRLAVAQQELEGTLVTTLGDFEKLQESYVKLQAESAGGGKAAKKAIAARKAAEAEMRQLKKKLQGEEAKLKQARERIQEIEKKHKDAEADAKAAAEAAAEAGKAALGKCEAELQEARHDMGQLQLGKEMLVKETEALRKRFVHIEPVRYQLASANVVAQQQRVLAEVKQVMEVYPEASFTIKGHTCNIGSEDANLKLSENRAIVLRDFLVANGIAETRFKLVEGCGDTLPQASNDTDEGRRQNRRVEIKVER